MILSDKLIQTVDDITNVFTTLSR